MLLEGLADENKDLSVPPLMFSSLRFRLFMLFDHFKESNSEHLNMPSDV